METEVHQLGDYAHNYAYLVLVLFSFLPLLVCLVALLQKKKKYTSVLLEYLRKVFPFLFK